MSGRGRRAHRRSAEAVGARRESRPVPLPSSPGVETLAYAALMKLLGLPGSLRRASLNRALLVAAQDLLPPGVTLAIEDPGAVPLYDGDVDDDAHRPASVLALKQRITEADAVLIATPEYNYSIPGVLKNAIDWASRPGYRSPFRDKPVAIVSASPGAVGGARAQGHLKQVLLGMAAEVFPYPEFLVGTAHEKIVDGRLVHEDTRAHLRTMLAALVAWLERRRPA
jgi:chromate reductase, NAD(P)H dehydrogenase (quinone)